MHPQFMYVSCTHPILALDRGTSLWSLFTIGYTHRALNPEIRSSLV